ncbi:hypothetical protein HDU97_004136, partial [Phlyctochytrium planicorne]
MTEQTPPSVPVTPPPEERKNRKQDSAVQVSIRRDQDDLASIRTPPASPTNRQHPVNDVGESSPSLQPRRLFTVDANSEPALGGSPQREDSSLIRVFHEGTLSSTPDTTRESEDSDDVKKTPSSSAEDIKASPAHAQVAEEEAAADKSSMVATRSTATVNVVSDEKFGTTSSSQKASVVLDQEATHIQEEGNEKSKFASELTREIVSRDPSAPANETHEREPFVASSSSLKEPSSNGEKVKKDYSPIDEPSTFPTISPPSSPQISLRSDQDFFLESDFHWASSPELEHAYESPPASPLQSNFDATPTTEAGPPELIDPCGAGA